MAWKNDNPNGIHRDLDDDEEKEFRQWARANFVPAVESIDNKIGVWHPIVIDECILMKLEFNNKNND